MEVRRTVPVKLDVASDDAALLHETVEEFLVAANYVVANCRDEDGKVLTAKNQLHGRTYEAVRERTDLHANMVQAARSRAADALKATVSPGKPAASERSERAKRAASLGIPASEARGSQREFRSRAAGARRGRST